MNRRHFLLAPPALAISSLALPGTTLAAPQAIHSKTQLLPRSGSNPRIVICGGGWGGMTSARYIKQLVPQAEVILLERNPTFWSGPMSNKWLIDIVNTDFVNHDMLNPANKYGYTLINTEVNGIEREKNRAYHPWSIRLRLSGSIRWYPQCLRCLVW